MFVCAGAGDDRNVHAAQFLDFVEIDLRKNQLLTHANRVVAATVKRFGRYAAKVSNTRQGDRYQPVEKFVHAIAAERYHDADGHALPQFERSDRLLRFGNYRL